MTTLDDCLFIGLDAAPTRELAASLHLDLVAPPPLRSAEGWSWSFADDITSFVATIDALPVASNVVVCTWPEHVEPRALTDVTATTWVNDVERSLALWYSVITAAAERCADGGAIAVVVERPAPVDTPGHTITTTVAEGIATLTRSVALVHGERGVRANTVTTAIATAPETLVGMAPALATYPGTVSVEVAGAVRMVLGPDACGVTGTVVHADAGRS